MNILSGNNNRLRTPSDHYQYIWKERQIDYPDNIFGKTEDLVYSDAWKDINDEVAKRVYEIANICLTNSQKQVFNMLWNGATQQEAAEEQGLFQQSSIGKRIHGKNGIFTKLRNNLLTDRKFKILIRKLYEIEQNNDD